MKKLGKTSRRITIILTAPTIKAAIKKVFIAGEFRMAHFTSECIDSPVRCLAIEDAISLKIKDG